MKIKNTLLKAFAICATAILTTSYIAPFSVYAEDVNNPDGWNDSTKVTYGVYDHTEDTVVLSEEDYLSFMNLHGFAKGVYEYYYDTYHDVEGFPSYETFETYVLNYFTEDFFRALNSGRYLMNVYCTASSIQVIGQRLPGLYYPLLYETELKTGDPDTFTSTISPSGTRSLYWVIDNGVLVSIQPYIEQSNIPENNTTIEFYSRRDSTSWSDVTNAIIKLNSADNRGFYFSLGVNFPSLTLTKRGHFKLPYPYVSSYIGYNISFFYPFDAFNTVLQPPPFNYVPVYTSFPVWENDNSVFTFADRDWNTMTYSFRQAVSCTRNYTLSPYIVSEYENIPVPTATPTPIATATPTPLPTAIPTITLVPSPTPSGVSPIEGVETMFSLFTRKYDITVMGVTVGIRPFFIFIGCFIVGSVITMIQGGNKS